MHRNILINDQKISYSLRKSKKARRLRLSIYCDGDFVVTLPHEMNESFVEKFIHEKADWVLDRLKKITASGERKNRLLSRSSKKEYQQNKKQAFDLIKEKLENFNELYNFSYGRISIRNQRTRWGSCSRKGNLNFNYKIIFLPEKLADYIVVHELCHLKQFNHSRRFWDLVAKTFPDYREMVRELRSS